jgi:GT2 family glycosyltransferase
MSTARDDRASRQEIGTEGVVPAVVAVVAASDPGPWFEECLGSLAQQDYPGLTLLVVDAASREDLAPRVERAAPGAFLRRLHEDRGPAASWNEALAGVEGASFYLICHDDVVLAPDAVGLLVEEAFRANAGVVAPKHLVFGDPEALLHVGQGLDRLGAVVERVQPGELDHGQHDAGQEVFVAPGGAMLVRADLFDRLGGFDPAIVAFGEDRDFCWRAQLAGARVVVAPGARVWHKEAMAAGERPVPPAAGTATVRALQRRHELYSTLVLNDGWSLLWLVPVLAVLAVGEVVVAELTGHRDRARAVVDAWRWNLGRFGALRAARARAAQVREVPDRAVRRRQVGGSARLLAYLRRAGAFGLHVAHLDTERLALAAEDQAVSPGSGRRGGGWRARHPRGQPRLAPMPAGDEAAALAAEVNRRIRWRSAGWLALVVVLLFGLRGLLAHGLPVLGQALPWPSLGGLWHAALSDWHAGDGMGATGAASPGVWLVAVLASVLGGATGLAQVVLVVACLAVGGVGVARMAGRLGSPGTRLAVSALYLLAGLPFDDLARGQWPALLAFAGAPWLLQGLVLVATRERSMRRSALGASVGLALVGSLDPPGLVLGVVAGVGLALGMVLADGWQAWRRAAQVAGAAVGGLLGALVLLLPWSAEALAGPGRWQVFFGGRVADAGVSGADLLRFAPGPVGQTPLAYLLVASAFAVLLVVRGWRWRWAAVLWSVAGVAWLVAWAGTAGWLGPVAPPATDLLALGLAALVGCVGLGVSALPGWLAAQGRRRGVWVGALALGVLLALLPAGGALAQGRSDLPSTGWGQATAFVARRAAPGQLRVLWLGPPAVLPGPSWPVTDGVAATLSTGSTVPSLPSQLDGSRPGPVGPLVAALREALAGRTVSLGQALAPEGVSDLVVVGSVAPTVLGYRSVVPAPSMAGVLGALTRQVDLAVVTSQSDFAVFRNTVALPVEGLLAASGREPVVPAVGQRPSAGTGQAGRAHWLAVLGVRPEANQASGVVPRGVLRVALAPAQRFDVQASGRSLARSVTEPATLEAVVPRRERVTVGFDGSWSNGLLLCLELVLWLAALAGLAGVAGRFGARWRRRAVGAAGSLAGTSGVSGGAEGPGAVDRSPLGPPGRRATGRALEGAGVRRPAHRPARGGRRGREPVGGRARGAGRSGS